MAILQKPKAKLISVGKASAKNALNKKAAAVKPSKSGGSGGGGRGGLKRGETYLYKNEPKQKAD